MNDRSDYLSEIDSILAEFGVLPEEEAEDRLENAEPADVPEQQWEEDARWSEADAEENFEPEENESVKEYRPQEKKKSPEPDALFTDEEDETVVWRQQTPIRLKPAPKKTFAGVLFGLLSAVLLAVLAVSVHPDVSIASLGGKTDGKTDLVSRLDVFVNNSKGAALDGVAYIRKLYRIPDGTAVPPAASLKAFGETTNVNDVLNIIEQARESGLLEGQNVIFSPDVDFYHDTKVLYYYDETLLVICWKEKIDGRVCSCVEVKVGDASQLRRKICEDTYGSSKLDYATALAAQVNAVTAMNADYYAARDLGITVYDSELYRFDEGLYGLLRKYNATDTLLIDGNGDFSYFRRGTETTRVEMERFLKENDIRFSIAFGPILVDNGTALNIDSYPIGEVNLEYSRAGIAQVDSLHYFYMAVSHSREGTPRCNINEFAQYMAGKGVKTAYCLDGGQTGEIVFNGNVFNYIDFGAERTVSDIIYFATALPEKEAER